MPLRSKERELRWLITFLSTFHLSVKSQDRKDGEIKVRCELTAQEEPWVQDECALPTVGSSPPPTFSNTVPGCNRGLVLIC